LGHSVTTTVSSLDGLKFIVGEVFDLVLLDIVLPEKDGISLLKEIKQFDKMLPVVMITGYRDADRVIDCYRNGAFDCLLKPFNFEYIKEKVLEILVPRKK
jgi:DNA-binding NtrC family response regulator